MRLAGLMGSQKRHVPPFSIGLLSPSFAYFLPSVAHVSFCIAGVAKQSPKLFSNGSVHSVFWKEVCRGSQQGFAPQVGGQAPEKGLPTKTIQLIMLFLTSGCANPSPFSATAAATLIGTGKILPFFAHCWPLCLGGRLPWALRKRWELIASNGLLLSLCHDDALF